MAQLQEISETNWTDCPPVEVISGKVSGAPLLKGTRMPADVVVANYADGLPAEEIAEVFELPAETVRSLLAYAVEHNPSLKP